MTNEQKGTIAQMKAEGKSYAEIAQKLGLSRSTISSFCQRNDLLCSPVRVNTVSAGNVEKQRVPAYRATVTFAEKPNEQALAEALRILMNVR